MRQPRIHVAPAAAPPAFARAVLDGGGAVVQAGEAEGLVWADGPRPEALRDLLGAHPGIRWVQLPWAGVERYREVLTPTRTWTSAKGVAAAIVAEHALALALAGGRDLHRFARASRWAANGGRTLVGAPVSIFGGGGVARALVRLLRPFGCRITVVRKRPRPMRGVPRVLGFEHRFEALRDADVVFLALALTPETLAVIGREELARMPSHAWLVNVARGAHVDTDSLVEALRTGRIAGAALDVTAPEPLPEQHPLWSLPNCIVTPHVASTPKLEEPLLLLRIAENVRRFAAGASLLGRVNPWLGY